MQQKYLTRIPRMYRFIAPVYTLLRPIWTRTLGRGVEECLERTTLPSFVNSAVVVLDLGCGPGSNLARLQRLGLPYAHYVGFDLSPAMLAARRGSISSRADFVQGDSYRLPFAEDSFDVIISTWMFSHLSQHRVVVEEALRILCTGGWFIVVCFSRPSGWLGYLEWIFEPLFQMKCVPLKNVFSWPNLVETKMYLAGCITIACLQKEPDDIITKN